MNGLRLAIEDIKRLWKTNVGINALGLMIFPLVYCYIYLLAFWDPAGQLDKLPLAVVNHDNGIIQGNMNINIGNDLVEKLRASNMSWHVVSQEEGDAGLNSGTYYLFLVIPEDFTYKAYSVGSSNPESALLIYKINEGASALGATITRRIMNEIGSSLRHELYMNYLKEIFNQILSGARGLRQAADASNQLAAGTSQAYQGSAALTNGLQQSSQGMNQLGTGLIKLQNGARDLAAGAAQLNQAIGAGVSLAEQYIDPIKAVLDVLNDLSKLVGDVNTALTEIITRIQQNNATLTAVLPGIGAAEQQIDTLKQGSLANIESVARQQTDDLSSAANAASQDNDPTKRIEVMAAPVKIEEENIHPVPTNGVGFSPYFISLALWTGSLVLFSMIDLKNVAVIPKRPISYMINKFLALASVSVFQSSLLIFILGLGLGLTPVTHHAQLFTFALVWGLVCCSIHFFLVYMLGHNPGQFFSIVLLMLQLAASGGSYPTELEPAFFTFLHPLLPMSYAVDGFRNIISIGNQATIAKDTSILIAFGVASLILLYVLKSRKFLDEISEYE